MNRNIVFFNIFLSAMVIYAGLQLRNVWQAAKRREAATMDAAPVKPTAVPKSPPLPAAEAVLAAGYNAIAQKDLFDASRNPNLMVEAPPPPPPIPMPSLPHYYGQMNLDGVTAILSEGANSPQNYVRPGETIGQFKLVDISEQGIVLEWNGELVRKRLDELADRSSNRAASTSLGPRR